MAYQYHPETDPDCIDPALKASKHPVFPPCDHFFVGTLSELLNTSFPLTAPKGTMAPPPRPSRDTTPLHPVFQHSYAESASVADSQWDHDDPPQGFYDSATCSLSGCNNPEQCDSSDCCKQPNCLHAPGSDTPPGPTDGHRELHQTDGLLDAQEDYRREEPISCQWLLQDQPCAASPQTLNDLGDHVYYKHIQPQKQQTCQWDKCNNVIDPQELVVHHAHDHHLDSYVCLWQDCKAPNFSSTDALDEHIKLVHTQRFDCHWAGCEVANDHSKDLTTHVYQEHLNISTAEPLQDPDHSPYAASSHDSNVISPGQTPNMPVSSSNTTTMSSPYTDGPPNLQKFHLCMWKFDTIPSDGTIYCGESIFGLEIDFEKHVQAHVTKTVVGGPKGHALVCKWHLCARDEAPFRDRSMLNRHIHTHTGCMRFLPCRKVGC